MSAALSATAVLTTATAPTDPITVPAISFSQTAPILILLGAAVLRSCSRPSCPAGSATRCRSHWP